MSKRRQQKIIHQQFNEMSKIERDPYWQNEFTKASFGKFPQRFTYKGGILIFTKSNKKEKMIIPEDVSQAIENYKAFVRKHTYSKSRLEHEEDNKKNEEKITNNKSIEEYNWKAINKKKTKEVLIINFINKTAEELQLTPEKKYELSYKINLGMTLGIITPESFNYSGGEIQDIEEIYYDPETNSFRLNMNAKRKEKPRNETDFNLLNRVCCSNTLNFDYEWKSYIDNHINKNESNYQVIVYDSVYDSGSYEVSSL